MSLFVECHHDYALARALGIPRRALIHEHCKGNVINRLRTAVTAVKGMVDEDPNSDACPSDMSMYVLKQEAFNLRFRINKNDERKIVIEVCPMLESWLLDRAKACGISPVSYGLPQTVRDLHRPARFDRKPGFHRFLTDLAAVDDGMKTLKKWLGD